MNKNSIIGFVLIGLILFGFTWFQSKQYERQVQYQAQQDSIALAEKIKADSLWRLEHPEADSLDAVLMLDPEAVAEGSMSIFKDTLLAKSYHGEEQFVTLENDKVEVVLTSRGAQPYSVRIKDYRNYDSTALYIVKAGSSLLDYRIYAGENINTSDFTFDVVSEGGNEVEFHLPFAGGGYISQKYSLGDGYDVANVLSFVGMSVPRNVSALDMDWTLTIPRMEKGYKNEANYSKLNCYYNGEKKPEQFGMRGRNGSKRIENRLSWFAFQQQFFSAIMTTKNEFSSGAIGVAYASEDDPEHNLMTCQAQMRMDYLPGQDVSYENEFYFGPNHYQTLKSYGRKYEKIIPLGGSLVGWITKFVIIPLFNFLHRFISNFGLIILLMTIFIKIVVLPFTFKTYSSSAKMQAIKPEIDKINAKYPKQEDAMKKQQATMDLYKKAGINPMGGCLPMLFQFPILWAMFRFFPASIELRQQSFLWAEDLSTYDSIIDFGTRIPLLGDHLSLFAILVAVSTVLYSRVMNSSQMSGDDPNAATMRFMSNWMMPIMMFFICSSLSAALSYYYLLSNIITWLETWIIRKWFVHPDEIYAKLKASEGKKAPKSKWQQRLEEAQRMQEQMRKEQQKNNKR